MDIQEGDVVLVNVAPFIGSPRRNKESIPCVVLAIEGARLEVCAQPPYREVALWVEQQWIESKVDSPLAYFDLPEAASRGQRPRRSLTAAH